MAIINYSSFGQTVKKRKRVARGYASGTGKTGGRGEKGQKSRSGVSGIRVFEGGQTPIYRSLPIRGGGFATYGKNNITQVTVKKLIEIYKKLTVPIIEKKNFVDLKIIRSAKDKIKVIGIDINTINFDVECDYASKGAIEYFAKNNRKIIFLEEKKENIN